MRIRFTQGIAAAEWHYEPGEVVELADEVAAKYLHIGCAVEAEPKRCPHCKAALDEPPLTPPAPHEATTLSNPRRRG